ncbi:hypothetical protein CRM22_008279 [Opisthorchis felineus]|uniref:Uncharacterized protein n=1 Tax=Opisthorchis felineus TaxID=147828 RepID=A0A4S2LJW6_OPIFE|nr:hypothetical protein CRM22_008279 [Opisthorchis felineus]
MFDIPPVLTDNPSCFGISTEKNWRFISCSLGQIFVHFGHPSPCHFANPWRFRTARKLLAVILWIHTQRK